MAPKKKAGAKETAKKAAKSPPQRRPGAPDGVEGLVPIPYRWQRHHGNPEVVTLDHLASELVHAVAKAKEHSPDNPMKYLSDKRYLEMVKASKLHAEKDEWSRGFVKKLLELLNDVSSESDSALQMDVLDQVYRWFQRHERALDPSPPDARKDLERTEFWNFCQNQTLPGSTSYHQAALHRVSVDLSEKEDQMFFSSLSPPLTPTTAAPLSRPVSAMSTYYSRPTSATSSFIPFSCPASSRPQSATLRPGLTSRPTSAQRMSRPTSARQSRPTSARQVSRPTSAGMSRPTSARLGRPDSARSTSAQTRSEQTSRSTSAQQPTSEPTMTSSRPPSASLPRPPVARPFNPGRRVDSRTKGMPSRMFTTLSGFHGAMRPEHEKYRCAVENMNERWLTRRNKDIVNKRFDEEVQEAVNEWAVRSARFEENLHQRFHSCSLVAMRNETLGRGAVLDVGEIEEEAKPEVRRQSVVPTPMNINFESMETDEIVDLHLKKIAHLRRHHHKLLHQPSEKMPVTMLVEDDSFVDLQQVCNLWREKHPMTYAGARSDFFEQRRMQQLKEVEKIKLLDVPITDKVLREALVAPVKSIRMDAIAPGPHVPRLLINPMMENKLAKLMMKTKKKKGARTRIK